MQNKAPKVSIGMPVYNGGKDLSLAIDSMLSQSFEDFELIISDNASTDDTDEICKHYANKDSRIIYIRHQENIGATDNYNCVVNHARGEYFKWASSNDSCDREFLLRCVTVLNEHPDVVLSYTKTRLYDNDLCDAEDYVEHLVLDGDAPVTRFKNLVTQTRLNNVMNGLIRTDDLKCTALIKKYYPSDVVLMAELTLYGKFIEVPEYMFYRRMNAASATKLKTPEEVLEHIDPALKKENHLVRWWMYLDYFLRVKHSPVAIVEKFALYFFLAKCVFWNIRPLTRDLFNAIGSRSQRTVA